MTEEQGQPTLYVHITKAIYRLLVSVMLFYKKLASDLQKEGYIINLYDPCIANKIINSGQHTVSWHVENLKFSHKKSQVNNKFVKWICKKYSTIGEVKVTRGKIHKYLGMMLNYKTEGQVSIDMQDYIKTMIQEFPKECLKGTNTQTPWDGNLFKVEENQVPLNNTMKEQFHRSTYQALFLCKRGHPDIIPGVSFLTTRVKEPI